MQYGKRVFVCDCCGVECERREDTFGGLPAGSGWFTLTKRGGGGISCMDKSVDLCSIKCLNEFVEEQYPLKDEDVEESPRPNLAEAFKNFPTGNSLSD